MEISVATSHVPSTEEEHGVNLLPQKESFKSKSTSREQSQFYCNECQRGLSDELAFEKHLKSELHFKRSLKVESVADSKRPRITKTLTEDSRKMQLTSITLKSTEDTNSASLSRSNSKFQVCPTCHSTVEKIKFGKHLVSHYHHHMSSLSGCKKDNDELILDNIDKVVKECPFQCLICNFFCNWEHDFSQHWNSNHRHNLEEDVNDNKVYWCSLCQMSAVTCEEMSEHLDGSYHNDILSVINRCVPMVLKKIALDNCEFCNKTFRFRFALREHVRKVHKMNDYQLANHLRYTCQYCTYATFSEKAFTAHLFLAHSEENSLTYKCRLCCVEFRTQIQMNRHRKTKEHKRKYKMKIEGCEKIDCGFCEKSFNEMSAIENHMWEAHQEQTSQCWSCGRRFAFPQELSAHVRLYCSADLNDNMEGLKIGKRIIGSISCDGISENGANNRKNCDFTCDNITMLYYHKMLKHLSTDGLNQSQKVQQQRLSCLICKKEISRGKLWQHLSTHGDTEDVRKRKCEKCFKVFPTIPHLLAHKNRTKNSCFNKKYKKNQSKNNPSFAERKQVGSQSSSDSGKINVRFKCNFLGCNYCTSKSSHLKIHQMVHDKNVKNRLSCLMCDTFSCKRKSELNRHMRARHPHESHSSEKLSSTYERKAQEKFSCDKCKYSSTSRQHYSRHLLTHMPRSKQLYKCKYCHFSTATVENLRKHVLKTNNHPGLTVYSCAQPNCKFSTDESNEYKNHLIDRHRNEFKSLQEIRTSIREYFLVRGVHET